MADKLCGEGLKTYVTVFMHGQHACGLVQVQSFVTQCQCRSSTEIDVDACGIGVYVALLGVGSVWNL